MLQQAIGPSQNSLKAKKNLKKSENCWTRKKHNKKKQTKDFPIVKKKQFKTF